MLLQPITVPFSKSTLKPSVYTLRVKIRDAAYKKEQNYNSNETEQK